MRWGEVIGKRLWIPLALILLSKVAIPQGGGVVGVGPRPSAHPAAGLGVRTPSPPSIVPPIRENRTH